jgi:hypothetical protein
MLTRTADTGRQRTIAGQPNTAAVTCKFHQRQQQKRTADSTSKGSVGGAAADNSRSAKLRHLSTAQQEKLQPRSTQGLPTRHYLTDKQQQVGTSRARGQLVACAFYVRKSQRPCANKNADQESVQSLHQLGPQPLKVICSHSG